MNINSLLYHTFGMSFLDTLQENALYGNSLKSTKVNF